MGEQVWGLLRRRPGATRQRCHAMTHGQIHSLDESRVQSSRETQSLQGAYEICLGPKPHHVRDVNQPPTVVALFHLTVDQTSRHLLLTHDPPSTTSYEPVSKMGREGIEIHI